ncbi:hypothetical protein DRQ18_01195 [bacterium]|nr:MAG: hypothetical protein DRQ18_01195 [bacterium]
MIYLFLFSYNVNMCLSPATVSYSPQDVNGDGVYDFYPGDKNMVEFSMGFNLVKGLNSYFSVGSEGFEARRDTQYVQINAVYVETGLEGFFSLKSVSPYVHAGPVVYSIDFYSSCPFKWERLWKVGVSAGTGIRFILKPVGLTFFVKYHFLRYSLRMPDVWKIKMYGLITGAGVNIIF